MENKNLKQLQFSVNHIKNKDDSRSLIRMYSELSNYIILEEGIKDIFNEYTETELLEQIVYNLTDSLYNLHYKLHPITTMVKYFEREYDNSNELSLGINQLFSFTVENNTYEFDTFEQLISDNYALMHRLAKEEFELFISFQDHITNYLEPVRNKTLENQLETIIANKKLLMSIDISFPYLILHYKEFPELSDMKSMNKIKDNLSKSNKNLWSGFYYDIGI